ncbi:hypothetical protein FHR32_003332 [Streptosporangium album]|uniref:Uncharacterized protein n=1 Tax=Streptosporangium album TaxID=47479 RepID=A0A7W7W947_9ACTN|nr:hypothetical protein [Streptosporangium album]MBB4939027.1 hypothetical protein [Streptosporangium album]
MTTTGYDLDALRVTFPRWAIFRSDAGAFYELCQAGGLLFIRRTYRSDAVLMHESEWLRTADGERLWLRVLLGQAR